MALLDIGEVLFVGLVETIGGVVVCLSDTHLATADIDQEVHVGTGGVAFELLQTFNSGDGALKGILVLATYGEQIGQSGGRASVDIHILRIFGVGGSLQGGLPIEFGHTLLVHPVAGIASPVVGFGGREAAVALKTVGQRHQLGIVLIMLGCLQGLVGYLSLFFTTTAIACNH